MCDMAEGVTREDEHSFLPVLNEERAHSGVRKIYFVSMFTVRNLTKQVT